MPTAFPFRPSLMATALATSLSASFPLYAQTSSDATPSSAPTSVSHSASHSASRSAPAATVPDAVPAAPVQQVQVRATAAAYDPRRDDTATRIVVGQEEIAKYGDTNVADVLKRVPGITVSSPNGRSAEIRMRGLGAGYTQILINGERAPNGFTLDSLSPDVIERIEVLRAASAEFSTQSVAGTVNIVLKKAVRSSQREVKLGARTGRGVSGPSASLQLSDKLGQLSYAIAGNLMAEQWTRQVSGSEQGFDLAGAPTLLRTAAGNEQGRINLLNFSPRLNWTRANGDTITWQNFVNLVRFRTQDHQVVTTALGALPRYPVFDTAGRSDNDVLRSELNWVQQLDDGARLDLKASLIGGQNTSENRSATPAGAARTLDNRVVLEARERGATTVGKYTRTVGVTHNLGLGWDAGYSVRSDSRVETEGARAVFPLLAGGEVSDATIARLAFYGQDEWRITPRWSLYLGARWEGIRTRITGNTFATGRAGSNVWSPVLQTLFKIPETKGDQLRFAVTRTYKAPNFQQLIPRRQNAVDNDSTDPDFAGNPDLKPELALGFDASYEHYWAEGALLSVSVSSRNIDDYTRTLVAFDGARWVARPVNAGRARTQGLELEAKFPLKAVIEGAPALDLRASVSANHSRVDGVPGPDNRLDGQTALSGNLGIDYKRGDLSTGASLAWKQGGQVRVSARQTTYLFQRRDLEAYALYKFTPRQQLRVALSNLLRQDFANRSSYLEDGRGLMVSDGRFKGGPSLRATLELKF